jgi:hypothetical protein
MVTRKRSAQENQNLLENVSHLIKWLLKAAALDIAMRLALICKLRSHTIH